MQPERIVRLPATGTSLARDLVRFLHGVCRALLQRADAALAAFPEVRIMTAESLAEVRASGRRFVIVNGKIVIHPERPPR